MVSSWPPTKRAWLAAVAMWCITAFGYVSNDYVDLAEDRVNKPNRPLPAGQVSDGIVRWLAFLLAVAALLISLRLGTLEAVVALLVLGLLTLYNLRLKGTPGSGNLLIAVLAGSTLLTGGVAAQGFNVRQWGPLLSPALSLMLFIAARELLKTIEDIAGDRAADKRTVATTLGSARTMEIVTILALCTLVATLYPIWRADYSWVYLVVMSVGLYAPLLYTIIYLRKDASPPRVARCLALLKASYFAGILALLVA